MRPFTVAPRMGCVALVMITALVQLASAVSVCSCGPHHALTQRHAEPTAPRTCCETERPSHSRADYSGVHDEGGAAAACQCPAHVPNRSVAAVQQSIRAEVDCSVFAIATGSWSGARDRETALVIPANASPPDSHWIQAGWSLRL